MSYQLARQAHAVLAVTSVFGAKIVPWVAVGSSIFFALSPWQTIQSIRKSKSTMKFTFSPYYFYTMQSYLFLLYAYATSNLLLSFTTSLGLILGLYYMGIFYRYSRDKKTAEVLVGAGGLICLALTWEAGIRSSRESQFVIGIVGNIVMILTAASPLSQVKAVVQSRDSSCLPYGMSLMNALAGGVWTLYGFLLDDIVVIFPNFVTLIMGLIQLFLIWKYPGKNGRKLPSYDRKSSSMIA